MHQSNLYPNSTEIIFDFQKLIRSPCKFSIDKDNIIDINKQHFEGGEIILCNPRKVSFFLCIHCLIECLSNVCQTCWLACKWQFWVMSAVDDIEWHDCWPRDPSWTFVLSGVEALGTFQHSEKKRTMLPTLLMVKRVLYRHSLWTVAPTNFISACVCLSCFYGLYLAYYGSDFDQSWWKC